MKNLFFLFAMFCFVACNTHVDTVDEEVDYIDYSTISADKLTVEDKILLDNIDFQNGKLSCLLDQSEALKLNINLNRYLNFIKFLDKKNLEIEDRLNKGAIVYFNDKAYSYNEKFKDSLGFGDDKSQELSTKYSVVELNDSNAPYYVNLVGASTIRIEADFFGYGTTVMCVEEFKYLRLFLANSYGLNHATVKFGRGNYGNSWNWNIKRLGNSKAIVYFYQIFVDPLIGEPLQKGVKITKYAEQQLIVIAALDNTAYLVKVFYREEDLFPYREEEVPPGGNAYINLNGICSNKLIFQVYEKKNLDNGKIYLNYIGEEVLYINL